VREIECAKSLPRNVSPGTHRGHNKVFLAALPIWRGQDAAATQQRSETGVFLFELQFQGITDGGLENLGAIGFSLLV
jgi:hypothetical protein